MIECPEIQEFAPDIVDDRTRFLNEFIYDLWICLVSREASLLGRREVLTGKAKFGILGDGKEVPQVAMARAFKKGDHRSGYYRDQTFMLALGLTTVEDYFAQLYADPINDPFTSGRQMNSHYATPYVDDQGEWIDQKNRYNSTADISSTAGQMARALGIALASKTYRHESTLPSDNLFSDQGNEVSFCTIGDASTSEGIFWETINAAAVQRVPMVVSVWDDGYGISVPIELQTVKGSISRALEGFLEGENGNGIRIYTVKGYDYAKLCDVYERAVQKTREDHVPCLIHVQDLTQPQGHSTSGSHERYKDEDRLKWEKEHDCNKKIIEWALEKGLVDEDIVLSMQQKAKEFVRNAKNNAWKAFEAQNHVFKSELTEIYDELIALNINGVQELKEAMLKMLSPQMSDYVKNGRRLKYFLAENGQKNGNLNKWVIDKMHWGKYQYESNLYSETKYAAIQVASKAPIYSENSKKLNGYEVLNQFFDRKLATNPKLLAFGEDVGQIGDVNQGFAGLQEKYGVGRVFDSGIREWSIMGQAIGLSMRGLRPIAEIQYLDYLVYGLSPLTDDLATLRYRCNGIQRAPAIIRTRGHRLEGIWHSGSPMQMLLGSMRGIYIMVPRNMVQAAGFYNTLLQSDDPGLVIECLNGYRLKETIPDNIDEFCLPLGVPEVLNEGEDITLVTYGSCVREAVEAVEMLKKQNISIELIDVQTLLPFDLEHSIVVSIKKTNRVIFLDEDVPGGATAYMMQKVMEEQNAYQYLDAKPRTISASENRTPYGSIGDYFVKPVAEDIVEVAMELIME